VGAESAEPNLSPYCYTTEQKPIYGRGRNVSVMFCIYRFIGLGYDFLPYG
jgi:hypothetical protein